MANYTYTHEYSAFPYSLYTVNQFLDLKDAPANVVALVEDIKDALANGAYSRASTLLTNNATVLKRYIVDAQYINKLDEELRNLEIYTRAKKQGLYYQSTHPSCVQGDVWIS